MHCSGSFLKVSVMLLVHVGLLPSRQSQQDLSLFQLDAKLYPSSGIIQYMLIILYQLIDSSYTFLYSR